MPAFLSFLCLYPLIGSFVLKGYALNPVAIQSEFPEKCMDDLGCFETGGVFYHPIFRPLSLLPFDKKHFNTRFLLFTPLSPHIPAHLNYTGDLQRMSSFNPYLQTKFIIHGFAITPQPNDAHYMLKDSLLMCDNYNVFLVDWSDTNQPPYPQAVANARVVAAQLTRLITNLQNTYGIRPESIHIIGHSLGAHIAGWTGKEIRNIGRISGLDPAGPYFYHADPAARLDASDAIFVDVIHSNAGNSYAEGLGISETIGDLDFFPNGGNDNPGCTGADQVKTLCNHFRALFFYVESVLNNYCRFYGIVCESYDSYLNGSCFNTYRLGFSLRAHVPVTAEMGYHAVQPQFPTRGKKLFLATASSSPFCMNQ